MSAQLASQQEHVETFAGPLPISRKETWLVAFAGAGFGAVWALISGQDASWDVRATYYYTTYAWLHGRMNYDIAPGQIGNWINPLIYVPQYLLINHTPPIVAGAALGAVAGLNFALVYLLARSMVRTLAFPTAAAIALFAAIGGVSTPQFLDSLGRVSGDPFISAAVLAGLLCIAMSVSPGGGPFMRRYGYGAAGVFLGAACGLKLTAAVYAVGLTVTLLVLCRLLALSWWRFTQYAVAGIAGFLLTGGYWCALLWAHYQNPFFPYWNRIFGSPWASRFDIRDMQSVPPSFVDALAYPFLWLQGTSTSEYVFRDTRFALLSLLLPVVLLYIVLLRSSEDRHALRRSAIVSREHFWLLLLFLSATYALWLKVFAIQRYMMVLGLIAMLAIFVLLERVIAGENAKAAIFVGLTVIVVPFTQYHAQLRVPYGPRWYQFAFSPAVSQPNTLYILLGDAPGSYVVRFLPGSDRIIRLTGNFFEPSLAGPGWDFLLGEKSLLGRAARNDIRAHQGPIRTLATTTLEPGDLLQLALFGLEINESGCETFHSNMDQFNSCPLVPRAPHPFLAASPQAHELAWLSWPVPNARLYVRREDQPWQLHSTSPLGYEYLSWFSPGDTLTFRMVEWNGATEGRLLATASVDEKGRVSVEEPALPSPTPSNPPAEKRP